MCFPRLPCTPAASEPAQLSPQAGWAQGSAQLCVHSLFTPSFLAADREPFMMNAVVVKNSLLQLRIQELTLPSLVRSKLESLQWNLQ